MQELSALKDLQNQIQQLQIRRQATAQSHYARGLQALSRAIESNFYNKEALSQTLAAWFEALRHNRRDPEPCAGLGYLFLLLGDTRMAIRYFQTALQIEPQHADSLHWLTYIGEQNRISATQAVSRSSLSFEQGDPEKELLQLQEELFQLLRQWLEKPLPDPGRAQHERIVQTQTYLEKTWKRFHEHMQKLEPKLDTGLLQHRLVALETLVHRYRSHQNLSQRFLALETEMQQELSHVESALVNLEQKGSSVSDTEIERLLDRCDLFADQLDEWCQQGYQTQSLASIYQKLAQELERLQDRLDEI